MKLLPRQHGFVLVLVLVILAIAGTVLGVSAYRCSRQVLQASEARQRLQDKWSELCLRCVLLPQVESILQTLEEETNTSVPEIRQTLTLGDSEYTLILADEQAKVNINALVFVHGNDAAVMIQESWPWATCIETDLDQYKYKKSSQDDTADTNTVGESKESPASQPAAEKPKTIAVPIVFESPDALLIYKNPRQLILVDSSPSLLGRLSFWGDGRMNIHRAEMDALTQLLSPLLSATDLGNFENFRQEHPEGNLSELMGVLALGDKTAPLVRGLLTDSSRCFSLWVIRQNGIGSHTTVLTEMRGEKGGSRVVGRLSW